VSLARIPFGVLPDGRPVEQFVLSSGALEARVLAWGATLASLEVPDRDGRRVNVVLGFDSLERYLAPHPYLGAVVGRYANRIAGARFSLDGTMHALSANEGTNQLHGGPVGFDRKLWEVEAVDGELTLACASADGDQGFPGRIRASVTYAVKGSALEVRYRATTDRATVINLTHHAYFNLSGGGRVNDHVLRIDAERFLPITPEKLPTGELRPVAGTPMDFRQPRPIGGHYDYCFVLNGADPAAEVESPVSGIRMAVSTTQPGVQFYTSDDFAGFCLETQHFPDSPNQPAFPSTVLRPGETYEHATVFRFSAR
jgi:aldose 1-epimerase